MLILSEKSCVDANDYKIPVEKSVQKIIVVWHIRVRINSSIS